MSLNSASTREHPNEAWKSLAQYLPSRSTDLDYWWQRVGPSAALVLEKAGYSIKSQYDALLFLYHWVVSNSAIFSCSIFKVRTNQMHIGP